MNFEQVAEKEAAEFEKMMAAKDESEKNQLAVIEEVEELKVIDPEKLEKGKEALKELTALANKIGQVSEVPRPTQNKSDVEIGERGLQAGNLDGLYRVAKAYHQAKFFEHFKSPEQILVAMNMALELGLQPTLALRQMYVLKGTPHLWGDLPLAAVMKSGKLKAMKESVYDKDGKEICSENKNMDADPESAVCTVERTSPNLKVERSFTIKEADKAGLTKGSKDTWKIYVKDMLRYRARSRALKDLFGDVLNGVSIGEFDVMTTETRDVSSVSDVNRLFEDKQPTVPAPIPQ